MLKIWGRKNSTNVKKVLWCAEETGVPYDLTEAGGAFGMVDDPAYRTLNPNGLVPTIEDDGLVLWESNAITRYLAARYGGEALYPAEPSARAAADKWMDWATSSIAAPFRDVFWGMVRTPPERRDHLAIEAGIRRVGELLAIADAALAKTPYLSGATLGIGDIPVGCFAYGWFEMPIERPQLPHVAAWYERLKARPAYRKAVMVPLS